MTREEKAINKVWVYQKGDELKVFATNEIAQAWFAKNDHEGVAFAYEVIGQSAANIQLASDPMTY